MMIEEALLLEKELQELRRKIEASGCRIRAVWVDEYGGAQSITLTSSDMLQVEIP